MGSDLTRLRGQSFSCRPAPILWSNGLRKMTPSREREFRSLPGAGGGGRPERGGTLMERKPFLCSLALVAGMMGAGGPTGQAASPRVKKSAFGKTAEGQAVDLYALTNRNGI